MNIKELAELERRLKSYDNDIIIDALKSITQELSPYISTIVIDLSYHHNKNIREFAYSALYYVREINLTKVIRDGLEDSDMKVFKMAAKLFHRDQIRA